MEKNNMEYYCDLENQPMITNGIRYFIKDADRMKLDKIFIENEIIASTETIPNSDYRDVKKGQKLYYIVGAIVVGIMIIIEIIDSYVR
jgi:hypothetical protein